MLQGGWDWDRSQIVCHQCKNRDSSFCCECPMDGDLPAGLQVPAEDGPAGLQVPAEDGPALGTVAQLGFQDGPALGSSGGRLT